MSNFQRQFINPIKRKVKKCQKVSSEEDNFGLSSFIDDSEEIIDLIEEFNGKCILLLNSEEFNNIEEQQKKNKVGENEFQILNKYIHQNSTPLELKLEKKQQSLEKVDNFSSLETQSYLSEDLNSDKYDYIVAQSGEINYLEGLNNFQKTVVSREKKQKIQKQKNRKSQVKNSISKKIFKLNRIQ